MISWENYHDDVGLYAMSFTDEWDYREEQPRTGNVYVTSGSMSTYTSTTSAVPMSQLSFCQVSDLSAG